MPTQAVKELNELCHVFNVLVSTGGFIERGQMQGREAVERYFERCKKLGFDIVNISSDSLCPLMTRSVW